MFSNNSTLFQHHQCGRGATERLSLQHNSCRPCLLHCAAGDTGAQSQVTTSTGTRSIPRPSPPTAAELPVAMPKPRTRPAGPPPEPVPVQHSTAFLLSKGKSQQQGVPGVAPLRRSRVKAQHSQDEAPFSGNAVQYWLRKADESLDEIEDAPPEAAKVMYEVSKGPVGKTTAKGVELVAKLGYAVGREAVKVAVPAAGQVAKWAVEQGARAALSAVQSGLKGTTQQAGSRAAGTTKTPPDAQDRKQ